MSVFRHYKTIPQFLRVVGQQAGYGPNRCPIGNFSTSSSPWNKHLHSGTLSLSFAEYNESGDKAGSPSPVLMTHGLLGSKQNWTSIAKAVSRATGRKVVTFDARNHGDSPDSEDMNYKVMVQDVIGLADQLQIDKFVFLGHSMGGRTAAATALKYPDRLSGVVVVDISPLNPGGVFAEIKRFIESMMAITFSSKMTLSEARREADSRLRSVAPDAGVRAFLLTNLAKGPNPNDEIFWKANLPVLLHKLNEIKQFPHNLLGHSASMPTLFIRGQNSVYVPDSEFDGIRKLFPKTEFATIPNSGHWPHADNPTEFVPTLVNFLKQHH